jgi:RNA polymerase sigma-70 factor (ECF subfamily)
VRAVRAAGKREDRFLVEQVQQGDQRAFETLLQKHQRRVLSLIGHTIRQPNEVEDLAQQVFLKVYTALPKFDFRAEFSTWLYRITVNECYDHLRRQRALKSYGGNEIQVGELVDLDRLSAKRSRPAENPARQAELKQVVEILFSRLSAEERLLLTLRELEGYSMEEIATVMDLKENTVKVRLFRARKRLLDLHHRLLKGNR